MKARGMYCARLSIAAEDAPSEDKVDEGQQPHRPLV